MGGEVSDQRRGELTDVGLEPDRVVTLVQDALAEDLAGGIDVTSAATVPAGSTATMDFVAHAAGVICGTSVAAVAFELCDSDVHVDVLISDGSIVGRGDIVLRAQGPTKPLLTAERTALNFLGHLSGIATTTNRWVVELELGGTTTRVRDTRKTTPLLRALEKYAVRCGGGLNHRMSLSDAALVKDNHVVAAGGVAAAFAAVRTEYPGIPVEVEVDSLGQLAEVLDAGADLVLLDNFTIEQTRRAVEMNRGRAALECSGGLSVADAAALAATGVDFVAVGALTHSAPVLDIGADISIRA